MSKVDYGDSQGHDWISYNGKKVCRHCGNIKRPDGKDSACRGKVYVRIRKDKET